MKPERTKTMNAKWYNYSDYAAFSVEGCERYCREVFDSCKLLGISATLFCGITVISQWPENN